MPDKVNLIAILLATDLSGVHMYTLSETISGNPVMEAIPGASLYGVWHVTSALTITILHQILQ